MNLIFCSKCRKNTAHVHVGHFDDPDTVKLCHLLVYECSACGTRRVWGCNEKDREGIGPRAEPIKNWCWL